jgi:hypothetical protein
VTGRILLVIGFQFDDRAADAVHEESAADQIGSDVMHAPREELAAELHA